MTTSKIQQELAKATEVEPSKGETILTVAYQKALLKAVSKLAEKDWDALTGETQDWFNDSADLVKAGKEPLPYPDLVAVTEEPTTRRRRSAEDEPTAAGAKKGDEVLIMTKKGNKYEGTVVDPDDKGELVLNTGAEEIGVSLAAIEKITVKTKEAAEEPTTRRRKAAEDDEAPAGADPEVGDTVRLTTARGTEKAGTVVEINSKIIAIKDTQGEELEYARDRIKDVKILAKATKDEPASRRRKAAEEDAPSARGEASTGLALREMVLDNLAWSKDEFVKAALKKFPGSKDTTVKLIFTELHKLVGLMKTRKMLK